MNNGQNFLICVGCWFSTKKKKKVNINTLRNLLKERGAMLKEIDMSRSIASQGPFHAIIHKMTDRMIEAMDGNEQAKHNMLDIERYIKENKDMVVVDPLHCVKMLLNRFQTYNLIKNTELCTKGVVNVPTFTLIESRDKDHILKRLKEDKVGFPFVCKKNISHGSESHKMSIIFNEDGLKDVDPPCVAQTFISHGALLYKIYIIADSFHVVERPSLRNLSKNKLKDHSTIFFNSHDISSGESSRSNLTTPDKEDRTAQPSLDMKLVTKLTTELNSEIDMTMFGVDIIVCPDTGKHYVIDVNVFPGYDGVPNFLEILVDHVLKKVRMSEKPNVYSNGLINNNSISLEENGICKKSKKALISANSNENCNRVTNGTLS